MQTLTTTLDGGWEVAERTPAQPWSAIAMTDGDKNWIPATVPGHVHQDLVRAGIVGDPFFRMQERGCQWVDWTDWVYRTTFTVDAARLAARGTSGRHFLHFHGLDTVARVYLNGALVGEAENMFVPHRFDVTDVLREGENTLRVEFDSALRVGQERALAYLGDGTSPRGRQHYFNFSPRAFIRKAQYMFGWDWGPELVSCGVWKPVELVTVPVAEIVDWSYTCNIAADGRFDIDIAVTVTKHDDRPIVVAASLFAAGDTTPSTRLEAGPGTYTVTLPIRGFRGERWTPHAGGEPQPHKRYLLNLKLLGAAVDEADEDETSAAAPLHLRGETVGFRTVELLHEPDAEGIGFRFRINGVDTFMKGANWIPDSTYPGAVTRERLRQRLTQARDAGFNMLRVWGGGLYESDDFYQICSELGILVWQDFPFACSMYPDDEEWFVEAVRAEATAAVRRLRNYPCLALWCGGNENLQLAEDRWAGDVQATRFYGDRLIHETLPAVAAAEDPSTPYLPNSPYSFAPGARANDDDNGDSHYWRVWHAQTGSTGDWVHYAESRSRFSSEFGFASPCGWTAWEGCSLPEDRDDPRSAVARWHDKTRKGYETYLGFIEKHYPRIESFDDLIYCGQANQADALTFGIEHWRRLKGHCWGTLYWQINDCWPTQSWATIDSEGDLKAAHYAARRFYAPLLLSIARESGDALAAHLVNDTLADVPGTVTITVRAFDGAEIARAAGPATAPANAASGAALTLPLTPDILSRAADVFVHAAFAGADGAVLAENVLLLADPKDLRLPDPGLEFHIESAGEGRMAVTVTAERFAGYVWLRLEGVAGPAPAWSDNWFHLLPGETRAVTVTGLPAELTAEEFQNRLRARTLCGRTPPPCPLPSEGKGEL